MVSFLCPSLSLAPLSLSLTQLPSQPFVSRSLADYARTHFQVEKSMKYAKYSLGI